MEPTVRNKADVWRDRIEAQRASGQSVRVWCQASGTREHSFYWWRARLGLSPTRRRSRSSRVAFAQVVVDAAVARKLTAAGQSLSAESQALSAPVTEALRLRLGGERELILPGSLPPEQVARLVHAIEAKPLRVEGKSSLSEGVA